MRRVVVLGCVTLGLLMLAAGPAFASRVKIHEIYYNSPGKDTGSNKSLNEEWILLHNTSSSKITMTNWTVRDAAGHVYKFGKFTLGPYKSVKIHTGTGSNTSTNRYWDQHWYIWNNNGDTGTLKDAKGNKLDSCHYSDPSEVSAYVMC